MAFEPYVNQPGQERPGCQHHGTSSELHAELVGHDVPFDLALLKIDAADLKPVEWVDSKASKVGHWVASAGVGEDAVAVGVLSVAAREVKGVKFTPPSASDRYEAAPNRGQVSIVGGAGGFGAVLETRRRRGARNNSNYLDSNPPGRPRNGTDGSE